MRFLVIGANGRTGRLIVEAALKKDHTVTALVRDTMAFEQEYGLTIIQGTPLNETEIEKAVKSTSEPPAAVIVALNASRASDSPLAKPIGPPHLMLSANTNLIRVMKRHGIRKIVTMSAFGVGDSFRNLNFLMRLTIRKTNMSAQFQDHDDVDKLLKQSDVDYVLVRPAMLKGDVALPVRHIGDQGQESTFMPSISRASVADFVIIAAEAQNWGRRTPVIYN